MSRGLYRAGLAVLTLLGLLLHVSGMDPPSLWLDDQWVGIVATRMSWREFFELRPPVPVGFAAILKASAFLLPDPELSLQLFPLACAVAVIPALATLVTRRSGQRSLGVLAAALIATSPRLVVYGVAAKQYASDCLITVILLLVGLPLLERWSLRRSVALAITTFAVLPISFTSVLVALPLINLAALAAYLRRPAPGTPFWRSLGIALVCDAGLAAVYLLLLHGHAHAALRDYWHGHFLPLDSASSAIRFISTRFWTFLAGALPDRELRWTALALAPSLVALIRIERTRMLGLYSLLFYAGMLAVSGMRLYPLGTGRTDAFSYPITILVLCLALRELTCRVRAQKAWRALFAGLAVVAAWRYARPASYGASGGYLEAPCQDAQLVQALEAELREGDALLIHPHGSFSVGYYGPWPIRLRPYAEYGHGFEVQLARDRTLSLPGYSDLMQRPERLQPDLDRFLAAHPGTRLVYYASHAVGPAHPWLDSAIRGNGYTPVRSIQAPLAALIVYEAP